MDDAPIRFISVDDHPSISEALDSAASETTDLRMIRAFPSVESVPRPMRDPSRVDVVLLDLSLPGRRGLAAVREVAAWGPLLVVFSATAIRRQVDEALASGADGFIGKALPTARVLDGVRAVHRGERPVWGVEEESGPQVHLTVTEVRLLELLCRDTRSAALAEALGVLPRTVDNMVTELYTKVGLVGHDRSRSALRDWARSRGYDTR